MSPAKDYDALPERDTSHSYEFKLGGRMWHCRARTELPLNILDAWTKPDPSRTKQVQVGSFMESVLVPDEVDDFMAMIQSPRSPLNFANADTLVNDTVAALLRRPTKRPSSSPGGPRVTRGRSVGSSSSGGTRKRR